MNLISDCVYGSGFAFWLLPSLGNGAVDDMPLKPAALRAGERSQIFACAARFDCRKLHWRTASGALRTLVLYVEHGPFLSSAF